MYAGRAAQSRDLCPSEHRQVRKQRTGSADAEFKSTLVTLGWKGLDHSVPCRSIPHTHTPPHDSNSIHLVMSSDYDFSDEEGYNEYYDDEEAMDIEAGMSPLAYLSP